MPQCINNSNKQFTGNEKSPLGLGYTAISEPVNKIMIGKDQNFYIVKEFSNGKKWSKINDMEEFFNNLPSECYNTGFVPKNLTLIENENGREQKFGGHKPFFIEGEKWPSKGDYHMTFFGQLIDPRKNDNFLYRIFIMIDDEDLIEDTWINKIELSEENLSKQVIITKPKYNEEFQSNQYFENNIFEPYAINGWSKFSELKSCSEIRSMYYIPDYIYTSGIPFSENQKKNNLNIKFEEQYWEFANIKAGVKVGGTPLSTQDHDQVQPYNFLQIEYENFLPYMFGDAGIAHISDDCQFTWDCC